MQVDGQDRRMTCDHRSRMVGIYLMFCAMRAVLIVQGATGFEKKVALLLQEEPKDPKCFAEAMTDFTCFWEEDEERAGSLDQYSFTFHYQKENSSRCPLRILPAAGGKKQFICNMNRTQMFVQMYIQVHREGKLIHKRSLFVDQVFLLDPPAKVTVTNTGQQGQLNVSWVPPPLKYMDDSMMYEVSYAVAGSHLGQVEVAGASSELILRGLRPGTKYKVRVRVNLDGITYSGYWSAWSEPVFTETLSAGFDPLIISLTLIISLILVVLSLTLFLSHRRFLKKKIWPTIPTPDKKFSGLFTVYGGDFKEWLRQTHGGFWLTPAYSYSEECPAPLEVLSEVTQCPSLSSPPLPPRVSRAVAPDRSKDLVKTSLDENEALERAAPAVGTDEWRSTSQKPWLADHLRVLHQLHHFPRSQSSLLESQDAYVTLSANEYGGQESVEEVPEEALPLEVLFASKKTPLYESHSDLGSMQQSSGSGGLSSQSSFEYPNQSWMPKGTGYTYMAVADSGVSMDYSPMSRVEDFGKGNIYTNEIPAFRRPCLQRQLRILDDGL